MSELRNVVGAAPRWPALAFAAIAACACVFAFVGLDASDYWIDELYTLHVMGHGQGLAELWRRALTDTHPPLYYVLLYAWSQLAGNGEAALRLPSAVAAVLALGVFGSGLRRVFSPAALAFALAAGAVSVFWFEQSQNARSYALCLLLSAGLLSSAVALRRRAQTSDVFPFAHWAALSVLGLIASFTHAYLLLCVGMLLLFLIATQRDTRLRVALAVSGVAILALNVGFVLLLLHCTQQDVHQLWFRNDARFFYVQLLSASRDLLSGGTMLAVLALLGRWVWRRLRAVPHDPARTCGQADWVAALCGCVLVGMVVSGIVVSVAIAPSFSARNLLTAAPFAWALLARLYDVAGPSARSRGGRIAAAVLIVLVGAQLWLLRGRPLQRNEAWRGSAQVVQRLPGCRDVVLPVVLPYKFGPSSAPYRRLAEQDFFGHYLQGHRLRAYTPDELAGRTAAEGLAAQLAARAQAAAGGGCALLAWGVHDLNAAAARRLAQDLARLPGVAPNRVLVQPVLRWRRRGLGWHPVADGFVFLAAPPLRAGRAPTDPGMPAAVARLPALGAPWVSSADGAVCAPDCAAAPGTGARP
ncbi:glycosyltransferase family 39 protein [Xanthomonas sp. CFBP 8703]|uniref:Glycosyltransferase family 39 protein n=1 Tax=Xanthomonas bonasiae TaxID=2810351 RepID=A0ABS3B2J4_9XANT|nr:glycosyltransferase family 39 protein [Xanthomonas bonasiae]